MRRFLSVLLGVSMLLSVAGVSNVQAGAMSSQQKIAQMDAHLQKFMTCFLSQYDESKYTEEQMNEFNFYVSNAALFIDMARWLSNGKDKQKDVDFLMNKTMILLHRGQDYAASVLHIHCPL